MDVTRLTKHEKQRIDEFMIEAENICKQIDPKGWELNNKQWDKYCDTLRFCMDYAERHDGKVRQTLKPEDLGAGYVSMRIMNLDICLSDLNDFERIMGYVSCFGVMPHTDGTCDVGFTIPDVLKPKASNKEWCEVKELGKQFNPREIKAP